LDRLLIPTFHADGRGDRLERWHLARRGDGWRLLVWTGPRVIDHIKLVLQRLGYDVAWDGLRAEEPKQWAGALNLDRSLDSVGMDLLTLLSEVLVLTTPDVLASAIALDFYKTVIEGLNPTDWPNTEAGELVHRMKYWTEDASAQEAALEGIAERMSAVVQRHPIYRETSIIQVPGHDSSRVSWGERLAESVAEMTGLPLVAAQARRSQRPAAKERQARNDLWGEFLLGPEVSGKTVLAVDDTYGQGDTLKGIAIAAKRAGAKEVHAMLATRNMRK
jgi:hypothetical protein